MRSLALAAAAWFVLMSLACGGGRGPTTKDKPVETPPPPAPAEKVAFGDKAKVGDLVVTLVESRSEGVAGLRDGQFAAVLATLVRFTVENQSAGKIADWKGWQGVAKIEDEHGNTFSPMDTSRWFGLPHNDTISGGERPDGGSRINPGKTYKGALYYEYIPATSKEVRITVPVGDRTFTFTGPRVGTKQ